MTARTSRFSLQPKMSSETAAQGDGGWEWMTLLRHLHLETLQRRREPWDLLVIGGGATGAGIALDAASRGYSVALLEKDDFGKGTSSRSTKLIHGGVRYLAQGQWRLVRESLRERTLLLRNAPTAVRPLSLVIPYSRRWERLWYELGLRLYHRLAGKWAIGDIQVLDRLATLSALPTLRGTGLRGSLVFVDGQFDDTDLLLRVLQTAARHGATVLNYCPVEQLLVKSGRVCGALARDCESGELLTLSARVMINATGVFCDSIRRLLPQNVPTLVQPSRGTHVVLPERFLPGGHGLLVPRTSDGRVLFALPWQGHTLIGTTDVATEDLAAEPKPTISEVDFLLTTAGLYLDPAPSRADVLSVFAGLRPLVGQRRQRVTARLSRSHVLHVDMPGLLTITGGKWTTYRHMAEQAVDLAADLAGLPPRRCVTVNLRLESDGQVDSMTRLTGDSDAEPLHPDLPYVVADVIHAVRNEMARTVEDVLARRTRALFLNARAALAIAPRVAAALARELGRDPGWAAAQVTAFAETAKSFLPPEPMAGP
jgi:glycerol-3-phosphate dehydrogenase